MAESSLEIDYSSHRRPRRHHPTPARSYPHSPAFSFSSSYNLPHLPTPRRSSRNRIPTTPFASDNDTSWQGQLSWQFEPTGGWRDSRNLGAALSPWAAASATTNPSSQIFQRSANDYYLSNIRNFPNPYYEYSSGYDALLPSGRLELQSYIARDHESSFVGRASSSSDSVVGRTSTSTHHEHKKSPKFLSLAAIKEGSSRNAGPLADKDDTSLIDYDATNDLEPQNIGTDPNSHHPRWLSASHAYRDDDSGEINYGVHDHHNHGHVSVHNHGGHGHGHHGMLHDQHDYRNHRDGVSYNSTHGHGGHYPMRHKTDDSLKSFDHGYGKHGHHSHDGRQSSSHHYGPGDHDRGYDDIDRESGEDADEDDFGAPRSVGLFSLFKYSTNFDILLVILGCVGSFINGGSLPWYSLLFGNFVNKIARDSISNKDQMMKDVEKVSLHCSYRLQRKWLLCSYL